MSGAHDVFTGVHDYSDGGDAWVQRWLDDGGREYCLIDSHTREGRLKIAKYLDKGCPEWIRALSGDLAGKNLEEMWTEKEDNFEAAGEKAEKFDRPQGQGRSLQSHGWVYRRTD